jgi:predicted ATPase
MKVKLKNIGVFKKTEYELGALTIICGDNNTGKTYATYSLYGFLRFFKGVFKILISDENVNTLITTNNLSFFINDDFIRLVLQNACDQYSKDIHNIFAAGIANFENSIFDLIIDKENIITEEVYSKNYAIGADIFLQIAKKSGKNDVLFNILKTDASFNLNNISTRANVKNVVEHELKHIIYKNIFPEQMVIISSERTGVSMFRTHLSNMQPQNILKEITKNPKINIQSIIDSLCSSTYALPVMENIAFINNLDSIKNNTSELSNNEKYQDIIKDFAALINGKIIFNKGELYYIPNNSKNKRLAIGSSSGSIRSLLYLHFYLHNMAHKGDMLIIDEPELNLHPNNQRRLARLLARLVNFGIKIFVTTHSDYIIKELNTLIMLNHKHKNDDNSEYIAKFLEKHKEEYNADQFISHEKIKVFMSNSKTKKDNPELFPAKIDEFYGIKADSFNYTINDMNKIQESIIFDEI